jgi:hypothetical protein
MDLSNAPISLESTPNDDNGVRSSTENPLSSATAVNKQPQVDTVDPKNIMLGTTSAESNNNAQKNDSDLVSLSEVDKASGNEAPITGKRRQARIKTAQTPEKSTPGKKPTTPKSKEKRKPADDKYKPKKQFTQLAANIKRAVQHFELGTFRAWSGSTYPENTPLELTYNAIESLRRGLKTLDHPKFEETHEELERITLEAEESESYNDAYKEIHKLIEGLSEQPKKKASTQNLKHKPTLTKKHPSFFSDIDEEVESEVDTRAKKRSKVETPVAPKVNKEFERMKKRVDRAVDRLKEEIMEMVEDLLG